MADEAALPTWFHVSERTWTVGHQIPAGQWGRTFRNFGTNERLADTFRWELALEVARVLADKQPSRLDCVFVSETLDLAERFASQFRKNAKIYQVQPLDALVPTFRGDFQLLVGGGNWLDVIPGRVREYWLGEARTLPELLVGGPVVVVGLVKDLALVQ